MAPETSMGRLSAFNFVSLDGYYKGPGEDISWHNHKSEEEDFAVDGLASGNALVFGRVTYELMAGYWPTAQALESSPAVAEGMNRAEKLVFSRTLTRADWANTTLMQGDMIETMRRLKRESVRDMTILGSGSILTQFAAEGLIDEYQIMINAIALGAGVSLFAGLPARLHLRLASVRQFKNGNALLRYVPLET